MIQFCTLLGIVGENAAVARAIARFVLLVQTAVLAAAAVFYLPGDTARLLRVVVCSYGGLAAILAIVLCNVRLLRRGEASAVRSLGLANRLTLFRFTLVVPTALLLADERWFAALALYALSAVTDVLDGAAARRRGEETRFGVIMDPLADIFTTAAVFGVLCLQGLVPTWVFAILIVRYASLGLGSLVLHFAVAPIRFKATRVGKAAGVLQAAAAALMISLTGAGADWREGFGDFLYPALAIIFGSVIVSQGIAAIRHIEKGTGHVGSQRGSRRIPTDIGHADAEPRGGDR